MRKLERRVIQGVVCGKCIVMICDDGTVWELERWGVPGCEDMAQWEWERVPDVPQPMKEQKE